MKAIITTRYGSPDVLELQRVPTPEPKANEVRIKIHASTVTAGDCEMRRFDLPAWLWLPVRLFMGVLKPRVNILGQELAGEIEAVGNNVTRFRVGDRVFAPTDMRLGAHAEFRCLKDTAPITPIPSNMGFEEAATIPTGGLNALYFLKKANLEADQTLLINGAGGSIGTYAVQMAKSWGVHVHAVDSASKLEMLRSIGADEVIDFETDDFAQRGEAYDVVFDVVSKDSFSRGLQCLKPGGLYLSANPSPVEAIRGWWVSKTGNKRYASGLAPYTQTDLEELCAMIESGAIKAVIHKRFSLDQMAEAHRFVEAGHKAGNVVINHAPSS